MIANEASRRDKTEDDSVASALFRSGDKRAPYIDPASHAHRIRQAITDYTDIGTPKRAGRHGLRQRNNANQRREKDEDGDLNCAIHSLQSSHCGTRSEWDIDSSTQPDVLG
jgi:hypothetical protein